MADYTPEQIEALAEFARVWVAWKGGPSEKEPPTNAALRLGILTPAYTLADWLRKEDWADRAADEGYDLDRSLSRAEYVRRQAAIIRKHAEDRS